MAMDAITRRIVSGSPRKTISPRAASTGTLSCTVAALVAFKAGKAVYQIAYPIPDARAPDAIAYQTPALLRDVAVNKQDAHHTGNESGAHEIARAYPGGVACSSAAQ